MEKKRCVVRTGLPVTGGAIYENMVAEVLKEDFEVVSWVFDPTKYSMLHYSRLKLVYQSLFEHPIESQFLITNSYFQYGLKLRKFEHRILIIHHVDQTHTKRKKINIFLEQKLLRELSKFDKIVVVAHYWKEYLKRYCREDMIGLIYPSFDVPSILSAVSNFDKKKRRQELKMPHNKILVYAGNASYAKGTDIVVNALDSSKYHVVTSGQKEHDFGTHHLFLNYEDYLRLLAVCDVTLVLSRLREGWNRIAHESILCGTPVIGSNVAGLGELLRITNQYIYDPAIPLEDQIIKVLEERHDRIERSRVRLLSFDTKYFKNSWLNLLNSFES